MNNENNRNGFKMTEIGWLPEEWEVVKLGDIVATFSGGTPRRDISEYWGGTIEWLKSGELADSKLFSSEEKITEIGLKNSSTKLVEEETLLIAMYGATAGKVGLARKRLTINQAICAIVPNENFLSEFYFYYFMFIRPQLLSERFGGAQPNLNQQIIKNLKIPLPPLSEQKKIAAVLSAVQEAREKTEAVVAAAKELKKSLMKYLFTYGPVPVTEADQVRLKETEIGVMPEEWEVKAIGDNLKATQYGISLRGSNSGIYPILRMNNLIDGKIDFSDLQFVNLDKNIFEKFRLNAGDILFNRTNSYDLVGKTSLFNLKAEFVFASYLIRLISNENVHPGFLNYYLNWGSSQKRLKMLATRGVSQSNISATKLKSFLVAIPRFDIQKNIAEYIFSLDKKIESEQSKKQALDQLFKSLLHNLMTGKIRVNHLEL